MAPGRVDKVPDQLYVLDAPARFDAARNINTAGCQLSYQGTNVGGIQPTGE
jgi:hypothetical protein